MAAAEPRSQRQESNLLRRAYRARTPPLGSRWRVVELRGVAPRCACLQGTALTCQTTPWSQGESNSRLLLAMQPSSHWTMTPRVERAGFEPAFLPCEGSVRPFELSPQRAREESNPVLRIWNPVGHHGLEPRAPVTWIEHASPDRQSGSLTRCLHGHEHGSRTAHRQGSDYRAARPALGALGRSRTCTRRLREPLHGPSCCEGFGVERRIELHRAGHSRSCFPKLLHHESGTRELNPPTPGPKPGRAPRASSPVHRVGIEPTSPGLQPGAITRSAADASRAPYENRTRPCGLKGRPPANSVTGRRAGDRSRTCCIALTGRAPHQQGPTGDGSEGWIRTNGSRVNSAVPFRLGTSEFGDGSGVRRLRLLLGCQRTRGRNLCCGWGTRTRTWVSGVRVRRSTN
jgi:hypothetical protein